MKKVKNRALSALLLVAIMVIGIGVYVVKYAVGGGKWAAFAANANVYQSGVLSVGTLTDRNGITLAAVTDGKRTYAESADVRKAALHVTGDASGNIGTGALSVFARQLIGYNFITGSYSRTGRGESVALTIDAKLNVEAYKALGNRKGTVIVYDYKTGEVLCMVSTPTYDPKEPPKIEDGDPKYEGVYLNRAISVAYSPGSTFKLVTAAAALERIKDIDDRVFNCEGSYKVGESAVTCSKAHGELTLEDALAVSCNTVFARLAIELGGDTLASYANRYGLTDKQSISGITTAGGSFDTAEAESIELAWSGVGQYNNMVCPAAMLRFVGAVANGGVAAEISLLKKTGVAVLANPSGSNIMNAETAELLSKMMSYNVKHTYGAENFPGLELYAKSGTAEVGGDKEPHAWFTGFVKNEGHPLAFVVVVENGGSGSSVAGAVANKVLQAAVSGGK